MRAGAPLRVTVFMWVVLTLTGWNAVRLWTAIAWHARFAEFVPSPGPIYIGLSGAVWVMTGLFVLWSLWRGERWTRSLMLASAAAYTVWYWLDRLLLQKEHTNWAFSLVLNLLLLLYIAYTTRSRYFQREAYEQQLKG